MVNAHTNNIRLLYSTILLFTKHFVGKTLLLHRFNMKHIENI